MTATRTVRDAAFEDLTARARIRQAAQDQFTEPGFDRATIRGIAAAAGVSAGLVRHHFGSKQALREAVDAYVIGEIRRISDAVWVAGESGDFSSSEVSREAVRPFQGYLVRAFADRSPTIAVIFDAMVKSTERFIAAADEHRTDEPYADQKTRAAVFTAMALGVPFMREHLSRVLGVDTFSLEGDRQVALALLDIYSHALTTPELAESARAVLESS